MHQFEVNLYLGISKKITGINEAVATLEEIGRGEILVGVKAEGYALVKGDPPAGRYGAAVPAAEGRLDQLGRVVCTDLRVDVHVLVDAPAMSRISNLLIRAELTSLSF